MSFLQRIVDRFRPLTTIHAHAGEVVFQCGIREARAQPLIRVAGDGKIIELGQPAATTKGGRLVRLFSTDRGTDDEAIRAFCRYHLMLISNANILRPRVTIDERSFRMNFGREAAGAFQRVLRADRFQADIASAT